MSYPLIVVPEILDKPFFEMNKKEAQAYLDWFLNIKEDRLEILNKVIVESGNNDWRFDFTVNSLAPLFDWFKSVVSARNKTLEEIKTEESKVTGLLKGYVDVGEKTFTNETVSICSDIGMYFGEVLKNEKKLEWSFILKPKRNAEYAQPILVKKGAKINLNPRAIIENVARGFIDDSFEKNELVKLYNVWKEFY